MSGTFVINGQRRRITAGVLFPHFSTSRPLDFSAKALLHRLLEEDGARTSHP